MNQLQANKLADLIEKGLSHYPEIKTLRKMFFSRDFGYGYLPSYACPMGIAALEAGLSYHDYDVKDITPMMHLTSQLGMQYSYDNQLWQVVYYYDAHKTTKPSTIVRLLRKGKFTNES